VARVTKAKIKACREDEFIPSLSLQEKADSGKFEP
jgi:hypothetical protein